MERIIKNGDGWRVGYHSQVQYQGLVGTDDWAFELTKAELDDFYRLLTQLVDTMESMAAELMDQERISCEAESDLLWVEVEGYPHDYSLRLILNANRRCEGNWAAGIAPKLLQGLKAMGLD